MYTTKNEESKIVEYIAEKLSNDVTVDIEVNPMDSWYKNDMNEDCRYYSVEKTLRRPCDGEIIKSEPEYIMVQLEDAKADKHYVQIYC